MYPDASFNLTSSTTQAYRCDDLNSFDFFKRHKMDENLIDTFLLDVAQDLR